MNIRIRILLGRHYLHQQEADNEGAALAVADLPVVDAVGLHHVEERLLPDPALLLEEVVLWVGPGYVSPDGCYHYNNCLRRHDVTRQHDTNLITFSQALWVLRRPEYFALS